ncbi:MAG: prohead protease/major capsid protein fusion protein [Burkholderiales bacterium]
MMELITRKASIIPASINAEQRTAEVIWSTGARVLRAPWFGDKFFEELSLAPGHVRMDRLTSGRAPLLDAHNGFDTRAVVGVVESARLEGGQGMARVRFAKDDEHADEIWNKVTQNILTNVSIGYRIHKAEKIEAEGKPPTVRAVDWEPYEISVVPIGADPGAHFRSLLTEEPSMDTTMNDDKKPAAPDAERERAATITRIVRIAKLEPTLAEEMISSGASLDAARSRVLELMIRRSGDDLGPPPGPSGVRFEVGPAIGDDFRAAAVDSLLLRAGIAVTKPHAAARDLGTPSIHALARTCLSRAGIRHGSLTIDALLSRAMTTSDFPLILADSVGKAVRNGYETEPASHRAWVRPVPVRDFKDQKRPILGSAPGLLQVGEHGEYTEGSMDEDSATYKVSKFGRIVALTWETLVNDDLGAFLRVQPALGQAARRKEADDVYALFALNAAAGPTMQDSVALFHATHGNLGTTGTYDAALLGAARTLLRKQTALGGGYLSLVPRFLIVPAEREQASEVLLAAATRTITTAPSSDTVPSWIGDLRLVVEPRLANGAVYLAADPPQIDTCELGLLEANQDGPTVETEREFIVDTQRYKVRHVFAAKFLDWRGIVKQPLS